MTKSILITGCSSGIGYDAAVTLKKRGWRVFASCRKPQDCKRLKDEGFDSPCIDHADAGSIDAGWAEVLEASDTHLDAVFLNGAFGIPALMEDTPRGAMEEIFQANFFGPHDLAARAARHMRTQGSGRIVFNSSILGLVSAPWRGPYAATKFAIEAMADAMRMELRGSGVHVVVIEPGPITSAFRVNTQNPYERWITPETSARAGDYKTSIEARMYRDSGTDPGELPPSAVTAKLCHALEHPTPRARYYVTWPTHVMAWADWLLPTAIKDMLLSRR